MLNERCSASTVIRRRLPVQLQCAGYLSLTRLAATSVSFSIPRMRTSEPKAEVAILNFYVSIAAIPARQNR
jgi:hypothetical protein